MTTIAYLGPEGTFSHAAARAATLSFCAKSQNPGDRAPNGSETTPAVNLLPVPTVADVFKAVSQGEADSGVVAVENTVEGPVFATIDALLASTDLVATGEVVLPISFDAFTLSDKKADDPGLTQATAHPHGLAQVRRYITEHGWQEVGADSNAAACRDLKENQIAFGPPLCGEIYHLHTLASGVEDHPGALTRFLVLTKRESAPAALAVRKDTVGGNWRTLLAITPRDTGPGVLARITEQFARRDLNLSSLISRPLKAQSGQYLFVVTLDAPPWQPESRALLADLLAAGDAIKTLGVWLADSAHDTVGGVLPGSLPPGSVTGAASAPALELGLLW